MTQILDLMKTWPPEGQGIFLIVAGLMGLGLYFGTIRWLVILFRGWPPAQPVCACCEDEE